MSTTLRTLASASVAVGIALMPVAVLAQETSAAPQATEDATAGVSGEKLDSFILAAVEIADVRQTYGTRLRGAESEEERQTIAKEGSAEIQKRVDEVPGITFDEYVEIANAASNDPELGERINKRLEAMQTN